MLIRLCGASYFAYHLRFNPARTVDQLNRLSDPDAWAIRLKVLYAMNQTVAAVIKQRIIPVLLHRDMWFITLTGATAGLSAAAVNIAARYTTDPGDLLGFLGGVIGAAAAVLGAVWLENRKNVKAGVDRRRGLEGAILAAALTSASVADHEDGNIFGAALGLDQAILVLKNNIASSPVPDTIAEISLANLKFPTKILRRYLDPVLAYGDSSGEPSVVEAAVLKGAAVPFYIALEIVITSGPYWSSDMVRIIAAARPKALVR